MKNSNDTIGKRTRDLPAVRQCLNQLPHHVHPVYLVLFIYSLIISRYSIRIPFLNTIRVRQIWSLFLAGKNTNKLAEFKEEPQSCNSTTEFTRSHHMLEVKNNGTIVAVMSRCVSLLNSCNHRCTHIGTKSTGDTRSQAENWYKFLLGS